MRKGLFLLAIVLIISCDAGDKAQHLIDTTIQVAGGDRYDRYEMEFDFRGRHYRSKRYKGNFIYQRTTADSTGITVDAFGNETPFSRTVNGKAVQIPDSMAVKYRNSINSVNYFVQLPYGLNDPAVFKKYLGSTTIKGKTYEMVEVTFSESGGGEDFEDVYLYWINADNDKVDYLAYSFLVNGGGMRFREAFNERFIEGIRFVDYRNYKPPSKDVALHELAQLFESGELELLSTILTENVRVSVYDE